MSWAKIPLEDEFGDNINKAMKGTGVSREELAREIGVDAATIARWVKYEKGADDAQARAIALKLKLDPAALADSAADRWYPPPIEPANVRRHSQRPHPSNGYVFFVKGGPAALVDPAGDPAHLLQVLRDGNYDLQYVLITHKHDDHCDAAAQVAAAYPKAKIVMHNLDVHAIGRLAPHAIDVGDETDLPFGDGRIRAFHTPGHTDGSACYLFESNVFTGDMLFAGSVGGAYGDESTYADILESIRASLFSLPDATAVMPGHGPPTTIALEKEHNPFFPHTG
jgi:glyoxylase-like metal-dependent hydrolase (beta-lactamase superfamily II)